MSESESPILAPFRKFNAWAESSPIVKFLDYAGRFTVVVALVFFLLESDKRAQARADAKQLRIDAAQGRKDGHDRKLSEYLTRTAIQRTRRQARPVR